MRTASALAARFDRMERLARTANGLPKNASPDAGALDAATITEPIVPLVQAEVVTDASGHRYVLGLANVHGRWIAANYEIVLPCAISDVGLGHPEIYRSVELTKKSGGAAALGSH
jgi:hypothetical protein